MKSSGRQIYLDSAATTLLKPKTVARAVSRALGTLASPGRGGHAASVRASEEAYLAREAAASLFGVTEHGKTQPERVIFTSSATHGLNIAIHSLVRKSSRVLVSGFEHNAVMRPLRSIGARVSIARGELFEPETIFLQLETRIEGTDCVIIDHISNVFGYVLPVERIAALCASAGVPLIIDASQSAGHTDIDMARLGAAFIAMPGHKGLYGPQGTGLLLCRESKGKDIGGIIQGGTGSNSRLDTMPDFLPDALEPGTHNMPGIAGLRRGLEFVAKTSVKKIGEHESALIAEAAARLRLLPRIHVYYPFNKQAAVSGVLSFTADGIDCEVFGEELSRRGIAVRAGLHCAPEAHRSAGTLGSGTVRISASYFTKRHDMDRLVKSVSEITA